MGEKIRRKRDALEFHKLGIIPSLVEVPLKAPGLGITKCILRLRETWKPCRSPLKKYFPMKMIQDTKADLVSSCRKDLISRILKNGIERSD